MARRRFQKGRLFLRGKKNPVWTGRWREDVIGADGRVIRIERSQVLGPKTEIPTQRLAERKLEQLLLRVNATDYRPIRVATVAEFAERWQGEVLVNRKPSTILVSKVHLRCHILPILGMLKLDEVGSEAQQYFVNRIAVRLSRKTVVNVLGTLSSMLGTAKRWGYACATVRIADLSLPESSVTKSARFFSADEVRKIIAAASEPWATLFSLAAMTGMRIGEILGLQLGDLDFQAGLIHVRRASWRGRIQTPKSAASVAALPMPMHLAEVLQSYLKQWPSNPMRLLFANKKGGPLLADKVVRDRLWPILDQLKIPRCGMHAFRHTHTSLLWDVGASATVAQAQLRHSDARITLGVYGHVMGDSQRQAVERIADLLRPDAPRLPQSSQLIQ